MSAVRFTLWLKTVLITFNRISAVSDISYFLERQEKNKKKKNQKKQKTSVEEF